MYTFVKASALWADAFYKSKCPYVCPSVCPSVCSLFEAPFKRLSAPASQSWRSKNVKDLESLGKPSGKTWSQIWTFLLTNCTNIYLISDTAYEVTLERQIMAIVANCPKLTDMLEARVWNTDRVSSRLLLSGPGTQQKEICCKFWIRHEAALVTDPSKVTSFPFVSFCNQSKFHLTIFKPVGMGAFQRLILYSDLQKVNFVTGPRWRGIFFQSLGFLDPRV